MLKDDDDIEDLRTRPLLDSVRSLVNKERQLAGLQLEEKEREAELWRKRYMQLQNETGFDHTAGPEGGSTRAQAYTTGRTRLEDTDDDWDNLQAASKKAGDTCLGKLRRKENLDLSRRKIGKQDLEGIAMKLRWLRGFTSVDLSDNNIDDTCTQPLKNLLELRQLRRLNLRGNDLGPSAAKVLLESLPRCKGLQVLRLEANVLISRASGTGAHVAAALRAAVKAGGCRHLWSLSITLDDFDGSFFMNAPRKTRKRGGLAATAPAPAPATRGSPATAPPAPSRQPPAHPMNALALARAFHPRAPGGGAGALLDGDNPDQTTGGHGRKPNTKGAAGSGRGSITSLGLPYARLHPRTIEELAAHAISSLTHLDLSFCHVGAAGAAALARALDGSVSATTTPRGAGVSGGNNRKGGALRGRGSQSLRSLKLPHNFIGDSGACALGRALSSNRCLTSLSLASNGIGFVGGRALATALNTRGTFVGGDDDGDVGGGGDGSGLAWLDVGDNPLGEKATELLVKAASVARGGGGAAATAVQIMGLDRVAGATVAMRAAVPRVDAADAGVSLEKGGVVRAAPMTLVAVFEEVSVQPEDASGDDGLVQVYQVLLDSRFETPVDQPGGGCSTLDVRWSFSPGKSHIDGCEWRVSRLRLGESEFAVKEGTGTEEGVVGGQTSSDDTELRDGYSRVRLRCNGWNKGDVLKIFVRPGGGGRVSCCDLAIGLVGTPVSTASPSYGLLWADPARDEGGFESMSSWREEDCPRSPSVAERARVAFLMSKNDPVTTDGGNNNGISGGGGGGDGDGRAHAMHRLRQVHVAHGGRILTSWHAVLAATPVTRLGQAATGDGINGGGVGGMGDGRRRSVCGYSWALVRTRGAVGDETCDLACRVVEQGAVPGRSPDPLFPSDHGRAIGSEDDGGREAAGVGPSAKGVPSTSSAWRWHCLDAETTGWLPGDLLSLWIRLDEVRSIPPPSHASGGGGAGGTPPAEAATRRAGKSPRRFELGYHPLARGFQLRVVDDARAEETARGCCALSLDRPNPVAIRSRARLDGGSATAGTSAAARLGDECFYFPAFSAAAVASGTCASNATVQLDFAAVCPMNIAAAGGSWA